MCCRSDSNRVSARLPCYLSKGPLKREFSEIYLTTCFGVRKFKNISAIRVIFFFLKMFKIGSKFRICKKKKKMPKMFFVSEIIASENVAINCLCSEDNTSHRQCMRYQAVLRFYIWFRETFSTWIVFTGIKKYGKVLSFRFQQRFGPFIMLLVKGSSETGLFRHLFNHVFGSP